MKYKVTALECRYGRDSTRLILHTQTPRGSTVRFASKQVNQKSMYDAERRQALRDGLTDLGLTV